MCVCIYVCKCVCVQCAFVGGAEYLCSMDLHGVYVQCAFVHVGVRVQCAFGWGACLYPYRGRKM